MSTLTSYASAAARDSAAPAASNTGLCIFRSETKAIEVSDGTNYLSYNNDGIAYDFSASNTHSYSFDGLNDYIDITGASGLFNGAQNFTISCWYKNTSGTVSLPIGMGTNASNNGIWINHFTDGVLYFVCRSGSTAGITTVTAPSSGQWIHAAMVKSGTTLTGYATPLGGITVSTTVTNAPLTTSSNVATNIRIGALSIANTTSSGLIDEFFLWDRALSSSELATVRDDHIYIGPTAGWRLENTVDATVGGSSYNGTNNGATPVAKATDSGNTAW